MQNQVLIVDDEQEWLDVLDILFKRKGWAVETANSGSEAWALLDEAVFDLVLSDLAMPGMSGLELLKRLRMESNNVPFIIMTGVGSIQTAVEAVHFGAFNYITKPFKTHDLAILAERAVEHGRMQRQLEQVRKEAPPVSGRMVIGTVKAMQDILTTISKVAKSTAPVLIQGETGTGKSILAAHIHKLSDRAGASFMTIDCGALPENLLESELFGHTKGAFTGAMNARRGLLEEAQGGSVFLDEIGELSPSMQVKILRAIQEHEIRPLGGNKSISINVRFITATNRNLPQDIKNGRFREDLYYRLAVILLHLPPLRERLEDIILFVGHFISKFNSRYGKNITNVTPAAMYTIMEQPWRGNIRELENVLERAVLLSSSDSITPADLGINLGELPEDVKADQQAIPLYKAVQEAEKKAILQALTISGDNRTQAAALLGIGRRTLYDKLEEYKL